MVCAKVVVDVLVVGPAVVVVVGPAGVVVVGIERAAVGDRVEVSV